MLWFDYISHICIELIQFIRIQIACFVLDGINDG